MKKFRGWLLALCLFLSLAIGFAACAPQDAAATEYTVTFDSVGGTSVASQTLGEGEKVAKPTDPTKDGNTFAGWWKESTYETEWDFREDVVTGNITLYAKWDTVKYTVTYVTNNGTDLVPEQVEPGSSVTAVPEKNGYTFAGWYKDEDLSQAWGSGDTVQGDTTLYAKWEKAAPRAVNVVKEFDVSNSAEVVLKNGLTLDGTAVDGFNNNPSGVIELVVTMEKGGAYALTAEAAKEWCDNPTSQFTVTVNGQLLEQRMICTGTGDWGTFRTVNPVNIELKTGANTIAIGTDPALGNDASVAKLRNFKLLDDSLAYTYIPYTAYYGDFTLTGAQVPAEEGQNHYAGDFSADGSALSFDVTMLAETELDLTVYASHASGDLFNFEVYVDDVQAGTIAVSQTVVSNRDGGFRAMEAARLTLTAGEHMIRLQKSAASAGATNVQLITLTAASGEATEPTQEYIVRFDSQGGTSVPSQSVLSGGKVSEPVSPSKPNNTFGGWFKDATCEQAWNFETDTVTADTTLYAKWTEAQVGEVEVLKTFDITDETQVVLSGGLTLADGNTAIDGLAGSPDGKVELHVNVEKAGTYAIVLEAAKEWCDNPVTRLEVAVNGAPISEQIICTGTGNWGEYRAVNPVNLTLNAGDNTITIGRVADLGDDESGAKLRNIRLLSGAVEYTYLPAVQYYGSFSMQNASAQPSDKPYYAGDFAAEGSSLSFDVNLLTAQSIDLTMYVSHQSDDAFTFEAYVDDVKLDDTIVVSRTQSPDDNRSGGFSALDALTLQLDAGVHTIRIQKAEGSVGTTNVQLVTLEASAQA